MSDHHSNSDPRPAYIDDLFKAGERLPAELRKEIIAAAPGSIAPLVALLREPELLHEDAPGLGYVPIHATEILGDLRAAEAAEPLLAILRDSEYMDIIFSAAIHALEKIGPPVLEPALAVLQSTPDDHDLQSTLAGVLGSIGVKDERAYEVLLRTLPRDPTTGSGALADYGDPRALPHLIRAFDDYVTPEDEVESPLGNQALIELREAIERLGGELTAAQRDKFDLALSAREAWRATLLDSLGRTRKPPPERLPPKTGRNEPCPCGSGKKYKKCCLRKGAEAPR